MLRRHLALCAGCQARVERLRQFERDLADKQPPVVDVDVPSEGLLVGVALYLGWRAVEGIFWVAHHI